MIAVRKRFYGRDDLCERAHAWVRAVNLDTLALLEEVVELSAAGVGKTDAAALRNGIRMLRDREQGKRNEFLLQGLRLKLELGRIPAARSNDFRSERIAIQTGSPSCGGRAGDWSAGRLADRPGDG